MIRITVLVEPVANNGFLARTGEPIPISARGAKPDEAVNSSKATMDLELKDGKQLRSVEMAAENPWLALAGTHDPNDPLFAEWKQEMGAYRHEVEDDQNRP